MSPIKTRTLKEELSLLDYAGRQAEDLLRAAGVDAAPLDPIAFAKSEAPLLKVIGAEFGDRFDGQLEYHPSKNRFLLFYNTKYDTPDSPIHHPRTRFSIAHELAHYYLGPHRAFLMQGGLPHGSKAEFWSDAHTEREADTFAARFLMPTELISPAVNKAELSIPRIHEIARTFETSLVSTAIRGVAVSHFPCAVVGIRDGMVRWFQVSDPLIEAGCYPGERGKLISNTAKTEYEQFRMGVPSNASSESTIGKWFRTYDKYHLDRIYLQEDFLPVSSMNTLVVLLTISEDDLFHYED